MAKSKAQAAQGARPVRPSRHVDSERWNRLLLIGGVIAVIVVAAGFIAYGWYDTKIKPLNKTVLSVGDTKFSLSHLERRMKYEVKTSPGIEQDINRRATLGGEMLAQLEFEATVLESADNLKVMVTDEDVAAEVKKRGNLADDVEPKIYANEFRKQVNDSGLKEGEYRQMLRAEILTQRLGDYFAFLAPKTEPQVKGRWMTFDTSDSAEQAVQRLNSGEDFGAVALALSLDKTPLERDWSPRGSLLLPTEVEDFMFGAQPGQLSTVVSVGDTYYVAQTQESDDNRPLDEQQRQQVAQRNLGDWVKQQEEKLDIARNFTQGDALKADGDVF